jgi:hypothetical protein
VQEKLLEAICGVSDDENMKKSMLELLILGEMDGREINIQVPPKGGAEKGGPNIMDLSNPTQMASEVYRFTNSSKGATWSSYLSSHLQNRIPYNDNYCGN